MVAVHTYTIDYNYCTVVKYTLIHYTTIIVHEIVVVIAVYTNNTDYYYCTVAHMNTTEVVHTNSRYTSGHKQFTY